MAVSTTPSISVIIPVYNAELYLSTALESVINQSLQPFEIIVVNDGSQDSSAVIAQKYGKYIHYLSQSNSGAAAARNRGTEVATGDYLAFLDADDFWIKTKLEKQIEVFKSDQSLSMIFGHVHQFISPEVPNPSRIKLDAQDEVLPGYVPGTLLIKRKAFFKVGLFDTKWKVGEFIDWFLKANEIGLRSQILPAIILERRIHSTNLGLLAQNARKDYVRIIKASLDRRRQQGQ
ncbi:glycosyltransferase family A protein [Candidatus Neomarinimicrobiota bacterium]